ncbi:MAG TPA: type II toxin-antitoxin system RelE/ParE family toxin [Pirellulaceae bacterium]|nr:type II toxin-antitoxin system RelE/ParE family toxin [Planctomycetaceae bacterium]HRX81233.1 type II toxin-antitoxin system RelE/ParE family toxin [Pirellulaceae bacterium]
MARVVKTPAAEVDLCDVWLHVADDSPTIADQFLDLLGAKCELLAKHSLLGESHPAFGDRIRCFPVASYVIVYRPIDDGIELVRVLHGRRDFESLF